MMKNIICFLIFIPLFTSAQYVGTGAVTQGLATTTNPNIYSCTGGRIPAIGTITATNSTVWTVPAEVNFTDTAFPFASDLYNQCNGNTYANYAAALAALNDSDIVTIDESGELITAFIFADNYFEMYVNGVAVGKDNVPYTPFNSNIVQFRVNYPFTISILLVDWEEHLGVGCEISNGFQYHMGDGGIVAVFKDTLNNIITATDSNWKAQTFYSAPILDLTCPTENGSLRLSNSCSTADSNNGTAYYGLHWNRPSNWTDASFDDSSWPNATTYSNATVGVNNKPAYTNFTNIFDDPSNDAQFIWTTNLILDNEVIVRHTVSTTTSLAETKINESNFYIYPNPVKDVFQIITDDSINNYEIRSICIYNSLGKKVIDIEKYTKYISVKGLTPGLYFINIKTNKDQKIKKLLVE